uniref:Rab proteins geranylgeranyltransferase component n=1 Tax=Globisporangium ultimum (strain ATCC 200006 / CBS 805.95 / DAOM BR144) TaxID=431595 RepID=K3WS56_GLOUD
MDQSLKETEYDVILVGTGMVEAILAGALARVGKKVLHLDQNDYYGSNYASFPLKQFRQWMQNESAAPRYFDEDDDVSSKVAKTISPEPLPDHVSNVLIQNSLRCNLLHESFADDAVKEELLAKSSSFSVDINPRLVLSSEALVETLITSGVGQYLEFTAIQHTYVHLPSSPSSDAAQDTVWEVPCSKKDVFQSKLLGMVEKRQLMKFLQFVADYGETVILGEDVGTKNERSLALGRALKRPQNKMNQAGDDRFTKIAPYLDKPFQELLEDHFKLSTKLQQVVVYCVGLSSFPATKNQISARDGLAAVYRYVASIGRYTSTAFLVPLYGVSEIAQSFCRLCAVYGGIYVLRAPIDSFLLDQEKNELVGIRASDGGILRSKHVIVNGSYVDSFSKKEGQNDHDRASKSHGQVLRGVFLLNASLRREMSRLMVVIPPEDAEFQNPFAIQVVQLDSGAYACPRDYFLVQVSMTLPSEWADDTERQQRLVLAVIERLVTSSIEEAKAKEIGEPTVAPSCWNDLVLWKVMYTMDHLASSSNTTSSLAQKSPHLPANLWPCETCVDVETEVSSSSTTLPVNPLEIHLESASANARAIFEQLCPDDEFLPKSASAEQAEKEALEDEHDAVLKAAQALAEQTTLSATVEATEKEEKNEEATGGLTASPAPISTEVASTTQGKYVTDPSLSPTSQV